MSIQSTTKLTRQEAEERVVFKIIQEKQEELERVVRQHIATKSDEELEDELESTFDNYLIVPLSEEVKEGK